MSTPATTPTINAASYGQNQISRFQNFSVSGQILTTDTGTLHLILAPRNAKHQVFIRRIVINVGTTGTTITVKFQSSSTSQPVFTPPQFAAIGKDFVYYGDVGAALPAGEGLDLVLSGAGSAFTFLVEGYVAPVPQSTAVMIPSEAIP